jgi:hypothetical protein
MIEAWSEPGSGIHAMPDEKPGPTPPPILNLLQQREIEARIVGPLVQAMRAELGEEKTLALVRRVIAELARQSGADLARRLGEASLEAFAQGLDRWSEGGALEIDRLEQSPQRLSFNVTRCRYAEMYRALGLGDLGSSLSCQRDFSLVEGFNPAIRLTRTQTLMEGAAYCDFRFQLAAPPPGEPQQDRSSGAGETAD